MTTIPLPQLRYLAVGALFFGSYAHATDGHDQTRIERIVDEAVKPIMQEYNVPGMAVALTVKGKRYFINYGVASKDNEQEVTEDTIFEIGSISKTFTATLAAYAEARGMLSLTDKASRYLPALADSSFDRISLLELGTYTAGSLPLQFPDDVSKENMIAYYRNWHPAHAPGTHRRYSNPSIGLFGYLAAKSMGEPFDILMEEKLFPMLGLSSTYIRVPDEYMGDYAYGYSKDGTPIRVSPGVLDSEAYGVKTTAADMIRFIEANIDVKKLDETLQRAIAVTHTGYYEVGDMTQGLGWEMYVWPTDIDRLLAGNSPQMVFEAHEVSRLSPSLPPRESTLINKTGSTNGFGAYVAFVPAENLGIVMLANRNYPIAERVSVAHRILMAFDG